MSTDVTSRCVIYARVSTKEQVSNLSLDTQRERCEAYARSNGWLVDRVFVEEGESAKTADRTELRHLVEHCRASRGRVQFVIVYALNRLARNTHDHLALRGVLAGMGVQLRSVTEPVEEGSAGRFVETLLAAVAQFDNDVRSERTVAGMKAAIVRGRWPYVAPIGYLNARDAAGRPTLVHDPERGPLVRRAFELAAAGRPQRDILLELRRLGLVGRRGGDFTAKHLAEVLRNGVYAGRLRVAAWGVEGASEFVPLVDPGLFREVQAVLRGRAPVAAKPQNPEFPLKGVTRCECGRPLVGYFARGRSGRYAYYECQRCRVRVKRDALEDAFVELLDELRPVPGLAELFRREVLAAYQEQEATATADAAVLLRRAAALRTRKERLVEGYVVERAMDRETYESMLAKVDDERTEVEAALSRAQASRLDAGALIDYATLVLARASALWHGAEHAQRLALLEFLFPDGLVWGKTNGFHRTGARGFDFNSLGGVENPEGGSGGPRFGRIEPFLRAAERLRAVLPVAA